MSELLSVAQAEALVLDHAGDFGTERVDLGASSGRVLRQAVRAERPQPPYHRVMMDGVAYKWGGGPFLRTEGMLRAGSRPAALRDPAACVEVMTGCVLPEGADTVVPIERLTREGDVFRLEAGYMPRAGQFVHRRGSDCAGGETLLEPGIRLGGPALAVLAGNGVAQVTVARAPSVGVVSTGDELVGVGAQVREWEIRRSNEYAITGSLAAQGFGRVERSVVVDDLATMIRALGAQLERHDVLVLSGGVSMGAFDHVPRALERLGVRQVFHKVAQRPGKPLWFGIGAQGQRVFGLPGNPVSATCCCARYVVPLLLAGQAGRHAPLLAPVPVRLGSAAKRISAMTRFVPVVLRRDAAGAAFPQPMPTSGDFNHLAATDGFVTLAAGPEAAPIGQEVPFYGW